MLQPSSISSAGSNLHPNSRPKLVYLPGIDGTGRLLYRQTRLFEEYEVHCVNYPQDRPSTYMELAALGAAQLEPEGGIVLAESFGGAVAMTLALTRPELVHRIVLVNTFARFPRRPLIQMLGFIGRYLPRWPAHPGTRLIRGRLFFPPDIAQPEQDAWWDRTSDVPMSAYGMRFVMVAKIDLRPRLREIEAPTIVFVSPNDRIVPPTAGRLLAKKLPKARLIELQAGHAALIHPRVDIAEMLRLSGPDAKRMSLCAPR